MARALSLYLLAAGGAASFAGVAGPSALSQARDYLDQGRYDEALTLLRADYDRAPEAAVLRLLALSQYRVGDLDGAAPLLEQAVQAYPEDVELRRAAARTALSLQQPDRARPHIERLLQHPADAEAHLLHGDALAAGGDSAAAVTAYEQALQQADAPRQQLALRLIPLYRGQGRAADARSLGEDAVAAAPDSFDADSLRLLLNAADAEDPNDLGVHLHYRFEYDDNVRLLPDEPGLGDDDSSDTRHVLMADILGRYGLGQRWDLFGEFHLYSSFHQDLETYDQAAFNFVLGPGWSGERFGLRMPFEFTRNNLDGERLSDTLSVSPGVWLRLGEATLLRGYVRYAEDDFVDALRENDNRDGQHLGGGLVLYHPFGSDGSHLRLLGEHFDDDTDGSNWDRSVTRLLAVADFRFAGDFSLGASYQYEKFDYDNLHDLFLQTRDDTVNTFSAWFAWQFQQSWEARVQGSYTDWDSNISAFAYQRSVVSAGVSWHY